MKKILLTLSIAWMTSGCVVSPDGNFYPSPNVGVGVGGASVDITPRIYNGSRSSVTVWLHPTYSVADAYPVAQAHCNRWGFYARPAYNWSASARIERRLNYTCVNYRPVLSGPHIIIGSPFYRNHYSRWHRGGRYNSRPYAGPRRRGTVFTPKPSPRHRPAYKAPSRRGTFGSGSRVTLPQNTTVQRGKPWEHNRNKNKAVISKPGTTVQRGKPWEHNTRKNKVSVSRPVYKSKRTGFGSSGSGAIKKKTSYKSKTSLGSGFGSVKTKTRTSYKTKNSGFGSIKPKTSSRRSKKGRLSL